MKRAAAAVTAGAGTGITLLALGMHFAHTRNWGGTGAVLGAFLALVAVAEIWCRVARKRAAGTYSYSLARTERARSRRQG